MQSDKGIGIVPMAAGLGVFIDKSDVAIGVFVNQRISEG